MIELGLSDSMDDFQWIFQALAIILLLAVAKKVLDINPIVILVTLIREFRDILHGRVSTGGVNALGVICVTLLALLLMGLESDSLLSDFIAKNVGAPQATSLRESVNLFQTLIVVAVVVIFSTYITKRGK